MRKYVINNENALLEILNYQLSNGKINGVSFKEYEKFIDLLKEKIEHNDMYEQKTAIYYDKPFEKIFLDTKYYLIRNDICPDIYLKNGIISVGYGLKDMDVKKYALFTGYMEKIVQDVLGEVININGEYTNNLIKLNNICASISAIIVDNVIENYIQSHVRLNNWPSKCTDIEEYVLKRDIGPLIDRELTRKGYLDLCINTLKNVSHKLGKNDTTTFFSNNDSNLLAFANYIDCFNLYELKFLKQYACYTNSVGSKEINIGVENNKIILLESKLCYYDYHDCKRYETNGTFIDVNRGDKIKRIITTYR